MATGPGDSLTKRVQISIECSDLQHKWNCFVFLHLHGRVEEVKNVPSNVPSHSNSWMPAAPPIYYHTVPAF